MADLRPGAVVEGADYRHRDRRRGDGTDELLQRHRPQHTQMPGDAACHVAERFSSRPPADAAAAGGRSGDD